MRQTVNRTVDRRTILTAAATLAAGALLPFRAIACEAAASGRTRLILLGTAGGPKPKITGASSSQVIVVKDVLYVVDCGDGVARQLALAGLALEKLRHLFVTHHHSDHNADYGNLLLLGWGAGLRTRVDAWGPPPLETMTRLFLEMNASDIEVRMADEGRVPLAPLIHPHELTKGGKVFEDENVKVTCTLVQHPEVRTAFAYRFDTADRSIVISGDTNRSENLIRLAKGADVLVHEALFVPAVDRIVGGIRNASTLKKHIIDSHTSAEDCGRVAAAAGVKTLVLSHLVPHDDPAITAAMWRDSAAKHFGGEIIVGRDLLEI